MPYNRRTMETIIESSLAGDKYALSRRKGNCHSMNFLFAPLKTASNFMQPMGVARCRAILMDDVRAQQTDLVVLLPEDVSRLRIDWKFLTK